MKFIVHARDQWKRKIWEHRQYCMPLGMNLYRGSLPHICPIMFTTSAGWSVRLNAFIHVVLYSSSALTVATNHQYYHSAVAFIFFVLLFSSYISSSDTKLRMLLSSMLQVWIQRDQIIRVSGFCAILMMHCFPWPYLVRVVSMYTSQNIPFSFPRGDD